MKIIKNDTIAILKLIVQLFHNSRLTFVIVRYVATAAVVIEMLMFARLLGPQAFGNYALSIQVVGFLLLVGAGSGAGYVMRYYQNQGDLSDIETNYIFGSLVQYLGGATVLLLCSFFSGSYLYISSLLLLIQIPYYISEPILRVRNKFVLPAIGRASGSIATVLLTLIMLIAGGRRLTPFPILELQEGLTLMIVGNTIGYTVYYSVIISGRHIDFSFQKLWQTCTNRKSLRRYWQQIIMPSGIYTISTVIFTTFTYIDRLFIEQNYPKLALSVYALAWQIAQGVLLLLTALNTISGVRIGESQSQEPKHLVLVANRQLKYSAYTGLAALGVAMLGGWLLSLTIYSDYQGLLTVTSILAFGYLFHGVAGSITMFLFFENQYLKISILYSVMIAISLMGNFISVNHKFSYIYPIFFSSLALAIASVSLLVLYQFLSKKYIANGEAKTVDL